MSIGGGLVEIVNVDGYDVSFGCEYDTILVLAEDRPGTINEATGWLVCQGITFAFLRVERQKRGGDAIHDHRRRTTRSIRRSLKRSKITCGCAGRGRFPRWMCSPLNRLLVACPGPLAGRMAGRLHHCGELKHDLVDVAPQPVLSRLVRLDDRMTGVVRVSLVACRLGLLSQQPMWLQIAERRK